MPTGIQRLKNTTDGTIVPGWGCILGIVLEILILAVALYIHQLLLGGWQLWWLFVLPIIALILPIFPLSLVLLTLTPRRGFKFPSSLVPPQWYWVQRDNIFGYRFRHPTDVETRKKRKKPFREPADMNGPEAD